MSKAERRILMPIKEESFRIGSGRYIQGKGYISRVGDEVCRRGNSPLIIGGETALSLTRKKLEESVASKCNKYEIAVHHGTCNEEDAKKFADVAKANGYDVIVGVGGGVICDFSKLVGYFAHLPVINVPTSSATCAAYTPLSIRYTPDGRTVGSLHFTYEVDGVIVDPEIIATQPVRLFLSGVFDSIAKYIELKQRFTEDTTEYPIGLDYAYFMSKRSFEILNDKTQKYIDDIENGNITDDVEEVIFNIIAATGAISGIARGSNQTALAHKFYETVRFFYPVKALPYLHGEIVGVGLLLQNHFNGEEQNNGYLLNLMKKYNMPCKIADIGIEESSFEDFYKKLCASTAIDGKNAAECAKFRKSLEYLWSIK